MSDVNFILKLLLPIAFVLLSIGQCLAWMNPANGTEISIYTSTPALFWFALIFALILGLAIIIRHLTKADLEKHVLVSGILLLAYASLSFISLFIVRGYYIYILLTGDVGYHYGVVDKILLTGFESVHYPLLHIQTAISQLFTGIPMDNMINITTVVFTVVLIIGINLLIRQITGNRYVRYMSYFVSLLVPFGCSMFTTGSWSFSMFIPFLAGFCITPYIIYCIFQLSESKRNVSHLVVYTIILNILLLAALFFHPVIYVVCFAFLCLSVVFFLLIPRKPIREMVRIGIPFVVTIFATFSAFLMWTLVIMKSGSGIVTRLFSFVEDIFSNLITKSATVDPVIGLTPSAPSVDSLVTLPVIEQPQVPTVSDTVVDSLVTLPVIEQPQVPAVSDTVVDSLGNTFASENLGGFLSTVLTSLQDFGIVGIIDMGLRYAGLMALFCLMLALLLPKLLSHISKPACQKIFCLYLLAGIAVVYTLVSLFVDMSVQMGRILPFVILSGIIVTGIILGKLLEKYWHTVTPKQRKTSVVLFSCILLVLTPMALGLYYPTMTESMYSSEQNTHALVDGNDFCLSYAKYDYSGSTLSIHPIRMTEAMYHSTSALQNGNPVKYTYGTQEMIDIDSHFGYQRNDLLNASLGENTYVAINKNIEKYYSVTPLLRYSMPRFTQSDFSHLNYDISSIKIYDSPAMQLLFTK